MRSAVTRVIAVLTLGLLFLAAGCHRGRVIIAPSGPPSPRVVVRPPRPAPGHVWVDGHWNWVGGKWAWHNGRWAKPARPGAVWAPGKWVKTPHGWKHAPGRWK